MRIYNTHVRDDIWTCDDDVDRQLRETFVSDRIIYCERYGQCYIRWMTELWSIVKVETYETFKR